MACKVTWLINTSTGFGRPGGFSETWYTDDGPTTAAQTSDLPARKRAAFLPKGAVLLGVRVQELGKRGIVYTKNYPGGREAPDQDIPQMAALCICKGAGVESYKRFQLRAISDVNVFQGDFTPDINYSQLIGEWFGSLMAGGYKYRGQNPTEAKVKILRINPDGTFVLNGALAFNVGDSLQVMTCKNDLGQNVSGSFVVKEKVDGANGKFEIWNGGQVLQSGVMRKVSIGLTTIDPGSFKILKISTRKVGRPFGLYRGRQKAKKKPL